MNESKDPEKLVEENASSEEDIIDLTEVVENPPEPEQDDVIDLTDVVETPPADSVIEDEEDDIIDLTEVVEPPEPVEETSHGLEEMVAGDIDEGQSRIDDSTDSLEAELPSGTDAPSITPEQLDAAIERVVKEMLSDKIDAILNQVIEKEVTKEIDRLKRLLGAEYSDNEESE